MKYLINNITKISIILASVDLIWGIYNLYKHKIFIGIIYILFSIFFILLIIKTKDDDKKIRY